MKRESELPPELQDRLIAATDAIGRSGARGIEIGHLDDDVPTHLARWYATASYQGTTVIAENHVDPVTATEALMVKLLVGGGCVKCRRRITLPGQSNSGSPKRCTWKRHGDMWVPGCVAADNVDEYIAERQMHR